MVQDRNLPEGTDKITPGAAAGGDEVVVVEAVVATSAPGGGATGGATGSRSSAGGGSASQTGSTGGGQSGGGSAGGGDGGRSGNGGKIMDKVRSGGEKLSGQAADKARDFVGQGLERSGDALSNVSRLVSETADGIDERLGGEYGDYARRVADAIDSTAEKLRSKNPDELIDDTRNFVRKSPTAAIAGAAILGFAVARLVKTGFDAARSDQDGSGTDTGSTGATGTTGTTDSMGRTGGTGRSSGGTGGTTGAS